MFKKRIALFLVLFFVLGTLVGCGGDKAPSEQKNDLKVGMVTDAGTIDDKSFNQGTWEGVVKAAEDFNLDTRYLKPSGTTEADYLREIGNLYDAGYKFVVCPGFKFETAIYEAQNRYEDGKYVIIDGSPVDPDGNAVVKENTVAVYFAEEQSGFLAGLATALQLKEGELGYIGGMEIPPVQKYNWGFQQGVQYANENYGTNLTMKAENVIYQGSFDNVAAGQQLAAQMFDKDVRAIFVAAGSVGIGSINEAKARMGNGEEAWIIGVDVDQYAEGIYEGDKSAVLTSAMKYIDTATYDLIKAELEGNFPGGQTLVFDAANNGVGIPRENPNLDDEVEAIVADVYTKLQSGELVVSNERGDLLR